MKAEHFTQHPDLCLQSALAAQDSVVNAGYLDTRVLFKIERSAQSKAGVAGPLYGPHLILFPNDCLVQTKAGAAGYQ